VVSGLDRDEDYACELMEIDYTRPCFDQYPIADISVEPHRICFTSGSKEA
jgi:hypothetical protein